MRTEKDRTFGIRGLPYSLHAILPNMAHGRPSSAKMVTVVCAANERISIILDSFRLRRSLGRDDPSLGRTTRSLGRDDPSIGCTTRSLGRDDPSIGRTSRPVGRDDPSIGRTNPIARHSFA